MFLSHLIDHNNPDDDDDDDEGLGDGDEMRRDNTPASNFLSLERSSSSIDESISECAVKLVGKVFANFSAFHDFVLKLGAQPSSLARDISLVSEPKQVGVSMEDEAYAQIKGNDNDPRRLDFVKSGHVYCKLCRASYNQRDKDPGVVQTKAKSYLRKDSGCFHIRVSLYHKGKDNSLKYVNTHPAPLLSNCFYLVLFASFYYVFFPPSCVSLLIHVHVLMYSCRITHASLKHLKGCGAFAKEVCGSRIIKYAKDLPSDCLTALEELVNTGVAVGLQPIISMVEKRVDGIAVDHKMIRELYDKLVADRGAHLRLFTKGIKECGDAIKTKGGIFESDAHCGDDGVEVFTCAFIALPCHKKYLDDKYTIAMVQVDATHGAVPNEMLMYSFVTLDSLHKQTTVAYGLSRSENANHLLLMARAVGLSADRGLETIISDEGTGILKFTDSMGVRNPRLCSLHWLNTLHLALSKGRSTTVADNSSSIIQEVRRLLYDTYSECHWDFAYQNLLTKCKEFVDSRAVKLPLWYEKLLFLGNNKEKLAHTFVNGFTGGSRSVQTAESSFGVFKKDDLATILRNGNYEDAFRRMWDVGVSQEKAKLEELIKLFSKGDFFSTYIKDHYADCCKKAVS